MAPTNEGASQLLELLPRVPIYEETPDKAAKTIRRRAASEVSYSEFYWQYMHANWPVILTDISNDWECRNWITSTDDDASNNCNNNSPNHFRAPIETATNINFDYLKSRIGDCMVPVADCNATSFDSHVKLELKFYDFIARWQRTIAERKAEHTVDIESELNNNDSPRAQTAETTDNLYLKDWHLAAQLPSYDFYKVPKFFASDWLNEQLVNLKRDDYRFVYMGPKDSWTSFHSDVFGSYSWSANIVGCKKWLMMPPGEELKLTDSLGKLPFIIDEETLRQRHVCFFTIDQKANEAVFVPSGWFHQVLNETDTISVNHNWFNACNTSYIWKNLQDNLHAVHAEIADCREMENFESHCQIMLRASFGINYLDFIELLEYIATRRMAALNKNNTSRKLLFDVYQMNDYHMRYDLECMRQLLNTVVNDKTIQESLQDLLARCQQLQQCLSEIEDEAFIEYPQ